MLRAFEGFIRPFKSVLKFLDDLQVLLRYMLTHFEAPERGGRSAAPAGGFGRPQPHPRHPERRTAPSGSSMDSNGLMRMCDLQLACDSA